MINRLEEVTGRVVPRETLDKLCAYVALLTEEAKRQNLVSASTLASVWERHILDSAQLARFESRDGASWADVGSGAGLPGIVIACIVAGPVTLVEPRRLRAEFLHRVCALLQINAHVDQQKAERTRGKYDMITARAVGSLSAVLAISQHLSTRKSVWVLPKGRQLDRELVEARRAWQGVFHVEQSVVDGDSKIVLVTGVEDRDDPHCSC